MRTTWHRAKDRQERLYTVARNGDASVLYLPNLDTKDLFGSSGGVMNDPDGKVVRFWRWEFSSREDLERQKRECEIVEEVPSSATPGWFFDRMHRGPEHPPVDVAARTATMRAARSLFARLRDAFQVVEPTRSHDAVFGHELRQLLILASTEVESSWRAVLAANSYPAGRWSTHDYVKLLGPMKLDQYVVRLASHPGYGDIVPFAGWDSSNATRSLDWYDAYNATKHNREEELHRATLGAAIHALAAVHVMTVAQFGFEDVERGHFHADEFNFERTPTWFPDAYIRPLLLPDQPLMEGGRCVDWPDEWVKGACPF